MFFVRESVAAQIALDLGIQAESSGCGHTAAAATRTPREIVHRELLPLVAETHMGKAVLQELLEAVVTGLRADGTASVDVRGVRHLALGERYKGGPGTLADRL
ncbi:hypothetical protein QP150_10165 [Sphingomonas sp. 22L2VL55-3]